MFTTCINKSHIIQFNIKLCVVWSVRRGRPGSVQTFTLWSVIRGFCAGQVEVSLSMSSLLRTGSYYNKAQQQNYCIWNYERNLSKNIQFFTDMNMLFVILHITEIMPELPYCDLWPLVCPARSITVCSERLDLFPWLM